MHIWMSVSVSLELSWPPSSMSNSFSRFMTCETVQSDIGSDGTWGQKQRNTKPKETKYETRLVSEQSQFLSWHLDHCLAITSRRNLNLIREACRICRNPMFQYVERLRNILAKKIIKTLPKGTGSVNLPKAQTFKRHYRKKVPADSEEAWRITQRWKDEKIWRSTALTGITKSWQIHTKCLYDMFSYVLLTRRGSSVESNHLESTT